MKIESPPSGFRNLLWLVCGWFFVLLGFVGILLPGLPTTGPLLMALACFSKGSERCHRWLMEHPWFGPPLRQWQQHRMISRRGKITAILMMCGSGGGIAFLSPLPLWAKGGLLLLLLIGILVVSRVPHTEKV